MGNTLFTWNLGKQWNNPISLQNWTNRFLPWKSQVGNSLEDVLSLSSTYPSLQDVIKGLKTGLLLWGIYFVKCTNPYARFYWKLVMWTFSLSVTFSWRSTLHVWIGLGLPVGSTATLLKHTGITTIVCIPRNTGRICFQVCQDSWQLKIIFCHWLVHCMRTTFTPYKWFTKGEF